MEDEEDVEDVDVEQIHPGNCWMIVLALALAKPMVPAISMS